MLQKEASGKTEYIKVYEISDRKILRPIKIFKGNGCVLSKSYVLDM